MQQVLKRQAPWRNTYFYQKSEVLYHLTYVFCDLWVKLRGEIYLHPLKILVFSALQSFEIQNRASKVLNRSFCVVQQSYSHYIY